MFRIRTHSGIEGWGECVDTLSVLEREFQDRIIPFLIGKQSTDRMRLVEKIGKWHPRAAAGVSMALTEIVAKQARMPITHLWGGAQRTAVPVYASFQSYSDRPDWVRHSLNLTEKAMADGYTQLKVKIGGKPFEEDRNHIIELTKMLADQARLALDANESYDSATTLLWNRVFANWDNWLWLEEPMPMWRLSEYRMLRPHCIVPLAGGENIQGVKQFLPLLQKGAVDIMNPDVLHVGGIDTFKETAQLVRHHGFRVSPHAYDGPLTRLYALIVQAVLPAWSKMRGEDIEPVEWDVMENPLINLLPIQPINGSVTIPTGIGIGIQPDLDHLQTYRWDGFSEA